jgi:hypothetical protein
MITRLDEKSHDIKASRSLFANTVPMLSDFGVAAVVGGFRRGFEPGGWRQLRIVERVIDVGDWHLSLRVAAAKRWKSKSRFRFADRAFAALAVALAIERLQIHFGLRR